MNSSMLFWRDDVAENINRYLRELQAALAGADPALIQDALFDAEEHLRSESAAREQAEGASAEGAIARFTAVVEAYGTPEEVAAAYLASPDTGAALQTASTLGVDRTSGAVSGHLEQTDARLGTEPGVASAHGFRGGPESAPARTRPTLWRRFFGVVADARVYKSLFYMLLSLGTGIAYFTIVVTGLSLSGGLLILIIGLPFLLLFLGVVRGLSFLEGRLVEVLLGTRMPRRPRSEPQGVGLVQRMWFWLKDGRTWLAMVYMVLQLPLGIVYFTVAVSGFAAALWMIVIPFIQVGVDHTYMDLNGREFLFQFWTLPFLVIGGALLLVIWLHLIRWIGRGHAAYAKAMLVRLAK